MADAYFRVSHKPVATLTSCGPGSCNLVMATACASADSSAYYAITANVPNGRRRVVVRSPGTDDSSPRTNPAFRRISAA